MMEKEKRWGKMYGKLLLLAGAVMLTATTCSKNDPAPPDEEEEEEQTETVVPFDKVPSLTDMIMYEVNPLVFGPDGTLPDVIDRLDSIKALGVNVLWIMPIYPEGELNGVGSPYCVRDYTAVNPDLGDLDDVKNLVSKAHELEMAVILDWVANHTAWDNDWIDNDSWYVKDSNGNIIIPPGTTWQDVAELNYDNAEMRLKMIKSMKYWIETCNIDGFRCDAVDYVPFDFWKQATDSLLAMPGRDLILLAESGKKESLTNGFQMNYSWDFQTKLKDIFSSNAAASGLTSTNSDEMNQVPSGKTKLRYTTNHDIYAWDGSPLQQFGNNDAALAAFVAAAFMSGVPLLYSGQETGYTQTISFFEPNPINWEQNRAVTNAYKKIVAARNANSSLIASTLKSYSDNEVIAFTHSDGSADLLVLINTRSTTVSYNLPSTLQNITWQDALNPQKRELATSAGLKPYEYLILKKQEND